MGLKWKPEEDAALLKLLSEGKSAREVAGILGRPRNSIIGRSHRLRDKNVSVPERPRKPLKAAKVAESFPDCGEMAQSLLNLTRHQCRWPLDNKFCDAEQQPGRSYCPEHVKLSYRPLYGASK